MHGQRSLIRDEHNPRGYARCDERDRCQGTRRRVRLDVPGHALRRDPRRLVRRAGGDGRRDPVPRERHARAQRPARAARGGRAPLRALRRRQPDQRPEPGADRGAPSRARRTRHRPADLLRQPQLGSRSSPTRSARWPTTASSARSRSSRPPTPPTPAAASTARTSSTPSRRSGPKRPRCVKTRMFFNHPGWIEANADRVRAALAQLGRGSDRPPRVHGALDPGRDGAGVPLRGSAARVGAARGGGRRSDRLRRSSTRAGAARRRCRGSSPTSSTISARSPRGASRTS